MKVFESRNGFTNKFVCVQKYDGNTLPSFHKVCFVLPTNLQQYNSIDRFVDEIRMKLDT